MARNVYGIDLGTYEIKVYDKKRTPYGRKRMSLQSPIRKQFLLSVMKHMKCMKKPREIYRLCFL